MKNFKNINNSVLADKNFLKEYTTKKFNELFNRSHFVSKLVLLIIFISIILILSKKPKKVGIISVRHEINIGNNLIKYAISIKLKELGYCPYIIGTHFLDYNISFINQTTNLVIIHNNFNEIKKNDFDILMVNSDQTWRKFDENFYDYGFLKFAKKWKIKKIVYGASIGYDYWNFTEKEDKIMKALLNNFHGISIREEGSIKLIEKHLGITPSLVLDPTLLIDKKYYLDIIRNYKNKTNMKKKYIFIYSVLYSKEVLNLTQTSKDILDLDSYYFELNNTNSIQDFIYYLVKSNAVITNSYHGKTHAIERYNSIKNIFGVKDRLFEYQQKVDIYQLTKPLNINYEKLNQLKSRSIEFLIKSLKQ